MHVCNTFTSQIKGNHWYACINHVYLIPMIPVLQLNTNRFVFKCNTGTWWTSQLEDSLYTPQQILIVGFSCNLL